MLFLAITKPKKKLQFFVKVILLLLLLAFLIPSLYNMIAEVNALEQYGQYVGEESPEEYPGEPMRVNGEVWEVKTGYWEDIATMLRGK